jgi:hypothetical protein
MLAGGERSMPDRPLRPQIWVTNAYEAGEGAALVAFVRPELISGAKIGFRSTCVAFVRRRREPRGAKRASAGSPGFSTTW